MSNNTTDISDIEDTVLTISDLDSNDENNYKSNDNDTDNETDSNIKKILNSQQKIKGRREKKRKLSQDSNTSSFVDLFNIPIKKLNFQKLSKTTINHDGEEGTNRNEENGSNFNRNNHQYSRAQSNQEADSDSNSDTWINQSTPTTISDICIHKKKLQDLEFELNNLIYKKTNNKILIVSGPSGSGKSTSVKIIAQKLMYEKLEKIKGRLQIDKNDLIVEFNILKSSEFGNSSIYYFTEFLNQCKLLTGINEKCIIIEELPNLFHQETKNEFQNAILSWIKMDNEFELPALVFCITEYDINNDDDNGGFNNFSNFTIENTFKVETVFGFNILKYENDIIKRIKFNKVAKTFLKNAILKICSLKSITLNKIINLKINKLSELGDLRNAINQFEFWYKFQYTKDQDTIEIDGKESNIDIFHSIGKLIYGSKHEDLEFEDFRKRYNLTNKPIPRLNNQLISVNKINLEIFTNLNNFNLCILENYSILNPKMGENVVELLDGLSFTDTQVQRSGNINILSDLSFISCFNVRINCEKLKNNMKDSNNRTQIKFSRDAKSNKKRFKILKELKEFQNIRYKVLHKESQFIYLNLNSLNLNLFDGFYLFKNLNSFKFKYHYYLKNNQTLNIKENRVGGMFLNSLYADDEFIVDDNNDDNNDDDDSGGVFDLKKIMSIYYGVIGDDSDSDPEVDRNEFEIDGEISSDPIEDSEEEINNKNGDDSDSNSYEFSDDSIELAVI